MGNNCCATGDRYNEGDKTIQDQMSEAIKNSARGGDHEFPGIGTSYGENQFIPIQNIAEIKRRNKKRRQETPTDT